MGTTREERRPRRRESRQAVSAALHDQAEGVRARHLLALAEVDAEFIKSRLRRARDFAGGAPWAGRDVPPAPGPEAPLIATLFFEDSTRTRNSFVVAAQRIGVGVIDLAAGSSSVNKGETIIDTARTFEALGARALVVRARQAGVARMIAEAVRCAVVNAGDGRHEHPTQGLLDAYAIAEAHGRLADFDLGGLRVVIVGDVVSSRVARSAIAGLTRLGAELIAVGPPALAPATLGSLGCLVTRDFDTVIPSADVVMMLRLQVERHAPRDERGAPRTEGGPRAAPIASVREFREFYAMTAARAARLKPGAVIMHPGPMNRGIEIDGDVADGAQSIITRQVACGVFVRAAVLEWCLGREPREVGA